MSLKGQKFSVVLMVDMQPDAGNTTMQVNYENRLKCVRSCSLKLLTYFSNKVPEDNFHWGFKFFNSVSSNVGDRWGFDNFSLRNFELFENRLEEKFETECMKRESLHRSAAKLMTSEYDNTPRSSRLASGPKSSSSLEDDDRSSMLKTGLKEICNDFSWELSDPSSPSKSTARQKDKRRSGKTDTSSVNLVFVFSPCPHSLEELRRFAECDGTNLTAVLYSFLPVYILKELKDKRKIQLSWVDVSSVKRDNFGKLQDLRGLKTMNEVLTQIGGSVIAASALIQNGSLFTSLLAPLFQKCMKDDGNNCENASGNNAYLEDRLPPLVMPTSSLLDAICKDELEDSQHDAYLDLPCSKMSQGKKMLEKIEVQSLHVKHSSQADNTEDPILQLTLPSGIPKGQGDGPTNDSVSLHTGERAPTKFALRLLGQGCVGTKHLPLHALHNGSVYLVTSKGVSTGNFFEPLISLLAQHQQVLVVECMDSVNQTPLTGILQPLTAVSATLTLVKTPFLPVLEKLMVFGPPTSSQTHPSNVRKFIEQSAASILGPYKAKQQELTSAFEDEPNQSNIHVRLKEQTLDTFNPNMAESWYPVVSRKNNHLTENLKNQSSGSRHKENKDILKCLRQFYKSNKNKTFGEQPSDQPSMNSNLRRSPRKSPRKSYGLGKSPAKSSNRALRKSPRKSLSRKNSDKVVVMDRNRSFTAPVSSRCTAIFQRSKSTLYDSPKKSEKGQITNDKLNKKSSVADLAVIDFKDTPDMVQHLLSLYQQTLDMRSNALHCAQTMVNIAHHYMQSFPASEEHNPLEEVDKVFNDYILQSNNQLRDKYMDPQLASLDDLKAAEFELQVLLPLELESLVRTENEELLESKVQQVVTKLRTLAFIKDTNHLNEFLSKTLLDNYEHTLPKVLVMIYEELLQPLPPQLEDFGEDDEMASSVQPPSNASSCNTDPRSALSNDDLTSVRSHRNRRSIGSFPSFTQGARRQIAIPGKVQGNNKMITRSAKKKASKKQKKESKAEMRKVRRNLFDPCEAGMVDDSNKEPPKTPQRASQRIAKKDLLSTTPKEHHILKTRKVEETPKHKQVRQALWRKQQTSVDSEVMVIQESPDKCLRADKSQGPVRTPGRLIGGAKRKSFYSDAPDKQSRSMTRFKESRSVEASKATQSRYNLLEARMSGRSPNKLNSSQLNSSQSSTSTSPRRIKPMCLFSHLLSPSPSKPLLSKGTPGSARRRLDISGCDSPSKNTRSQDNVGADSPTSHVTLPEYQSPFKNTAAKNLAFTPSKTAQFESLFAGRSFNASPSGSRTPVKTPRRIQATSLSLSQPINNLTRTPVKGILKTPGKQGPGTPLKDQALSFSELMMSPSRLTRQQVKSFMLSSSAPRPQFRHDLTSTLASSSSVKWEDECVESDKAGETDDSVFVSPTKSAAESTPSPETRPVTPNEQCAKVPQTPTRCPSDKTGKENCISPPTPKNSRKRVKTPDSLDKWPRRKRRNTLNSPSRKFVSCSPEQNDFVGSKQDLEKDSTENVGKVMDTPSKNPPPMTLNDKQQSGLPSYTPKKRKRDLAPSNDDIPNKLATGSPFKRFKLAALESRMLGSQGSSSEYFDSTDVFLSDSESSQSQKPTNRIITRIISGGSDGTSLQMSEPPSSPVFPLASHLLTRQGSSQDAWSDRDSQQSLSPVFQRKISNLIDNLDSDSDNSPKKPSVPNSPVVGSPAMNFRKFSPNVSAKSLSHLMMSPLISEKKSTGSPQKTAGQKKHTPNTAKHSRRSLYQSQP